MELFDREFDTEDMKSYIEENIDEFEGVDKKLLERHVADENLSDSERILLEKILVSHFNDFVCDRCAALVIVDGLEALRNDSSLCGYCQHILNKDD